MPSSSPTSDRPGDAAAGASAKRRLPGADCATHRDIVVAGASAGGVHPLTELVAGLPADCPAAILVVLHVLASGTSVLHNILDRAGPLPVAAATEGEPLERGRVYVAPPDHHLLLGDGHVVLSQEPRENGHRPAIDPLFRSASSEYGPRVVGVVLSGALDDGSAGMRAIRERGGIAVVQDPDDALYPSMPRSVIAHGGADHVVAISAMASLLCELIGAPLRAPRPGTGGAS